MIDPRRRRYSPYVRDLADRLGLRDWWFELADEPPYEPDAIASVRPWEGRRRATIRLSDGFLEAGPAEQRHTLCHELAHCFFAAMAEYLRQHLDGPAHPAFMLMFEYGIDATADALAPHLPLPPGVTSETETEAAAARRPRRGKGKGKARPK